MDSPEFAVLPDDRETGLGGADIGDEHGAFHAPSLQASTERINCTKGKR